MTTISAHVIREALRVHFPAQAYAVLEEVRNGTGYRHTQRYADALVCSCWPSRGLWIAGIEIKVERRDWLRELQDPAKSAEIQRWCKYWWIAAPAGLVHDGELPGTWGLLEYDEKKRGRDKLAVKTKAPELPAEAPAISFLASVLRSVQAQQDHYVAAKVYQEVEKVRLEYGVAAVEETKNKLSRCEVALEHAKRDVERLQVATREAAEIKALLGLHWGDDVAAAQKAMQTARELHQLNLAVLSGRLRTAADMLDRIMDGGSDGTNG